MIARAVRNLLEDRDHHVSFIGLRQDMTEYEVYALLDKEIRALNWLILIDTENSRGSKWVQFEIERVREYKKDIYKIRGDRFQGRSRYQTEEILQSCIRSFSRSLRVFLSYTGNDRILASQIDKFLWENGIESWDPRNKIVIHNWEKQIQKAIDETIEQGVFMPFISPATLRNQWAMKEIEYALENDGLILPLLLEDVDFDKFHPKLRWIESFYMGGNVPIDAKLRSLVATLNQMRYKTFEKNCGQVIEGS
jgi:hypothetical protein